MSVETLPRPPYSEQSFLPPPTTPCSVWVTLASTATSFADKSLRGDLPPAPLECVSRLEIPLL